jgi:hypothetical protein
MLNFSFNNEQHIYEQMKKAFQGFINESGKENRIPFPDLLVFLFFI